MRNRRWSVYINQDILTENLHSLTWINRVDFRFFKKDFKMTTLLRLMVIVLSILSNPLLAESLQPFKVAAVEFNPQFLQFETNLPPMVLAAEDAARKGAKLIVLPELSNSGYFYNSREQIAPFLDTIPGKTTKALETIAGKYHTYIAVGISEIDPQTQFAYNSAALIGPNGYIGKYRKNQLNSSDTTWAVRGNLGFPIFDTELGKIALVICYDDVYLQSLLIPALRGANIIAYITASDRLLTNEPGANANHSTIANIATLSGWMGLYIVATTRTDSETNPANGILTHYDGGASIWNPLGKNLAQAPISTPQHPTPPVSIYAEIDPLLYKNPAKEILQTRRRPELYQILSLYRAPSDPSASKESHQVKAALVQYSPIPGNKKANLNTIKNLLAKNKDLVGTNLIVFPENSLIGDGLTAQQMKQHAETLNDDSVKQMSLLAIQYQANLIFSMPEKIQNQFYQTAIFINEQGQLVGHYRKTHLNQQDKLWATAGNEIPIFITSIGRVGIIVGDEVQVPDLASVMAVKRADIVAIPTAWHGEYGGRVEVDPGLLIKPFPMNTMFMWYNFAKYAQSYTLVANFIGGAQNNLGSSGLYSLAPIQGFYPPQLASQDRQQVYTVSFKTLGAATWWINQNDYIIGRRTELIPPALMNMDSPCFKQWQQNSVANHFCWNN